MIKKLQIKDLECTLLNVPKIYKKDGEELYKEIDYLKN
jgi:hypothetical protein